jgi:4-amino-4-deoxy-L-arabinose transferase-like glycosyltransferase
MITKFDALLTANLKFVGSRRGVLIITTAVISWCWFLRWAVFSGVGPDDAEQLVFSQSLELGYSTGNPPLITWLVILMQQLLGVGVFAVITLNFLLLWSAYYLVYCCAKRVLADERLAALATLSLFAVYYIAWDSVFNYSNSLLMIVFIAATFLGLLRLEERGGASDYALLGFLLGLGFLAKYTYVLFAVPLLIAACFDPAMHNRIFNRMFALSIAIAIIVNVPHLVWMFENQTLLQSRAVDRFSQMGSQTFLKARALGILEVARILFDISMPMLAIVVIAFWPACKKLDWHGESAQRYQTILARTFLIAISVTLIGTLALGISRIRSHYMMILLLFPILFFARVKVSACKEWRFKGFAAILTSIILLVVTGLGLKYVIDPKRSSKAYYNIPYPQYAQQLKAAGFVHGTIFADWHTNPIAGNFRAQFPESRVFDYLWPHYIAPRDRQDGKCLVIWTPRADGSRRREFLNQANLYFKAGINLDTPAKFVTTEMRPGGRTTRLAYVLAPGKGQCR